MSGAALELGIYLPQVGFTWEELRARALLCEELGFHSLWLMDHLYPPELPDVASFEAWTAATALLAQTTRLRVGHLVLSATFRHPALLAKMATSLAAISGGRLELGLGSGSYRAEHERAGIAFGGPAERAARLADTLEVVRRAFGGPRIDYTGRGVALRDLPSLPGAALPRPRIHVGGAGERYTLPLVARHADVWNCPTYALAALPRKRDVLLAECARLGRDASDLRIALEAVLVLVAERRDLDAARALAERRFAGPGWGLAAGGFVGTPDEVIARIAELRAAGVSLFVFFTHDRASEATLRLFAERVMPAFAA